MKTSYRDATSNFSTHIKELMHKMSLSSVTIVTVIIRFIKTQLLKYFILNKEAVLSYIYICLK